MYVVGAIVVIEMMVDEKDGGRSLPEFFTFFSHYVVPYILTSISCYVILVVIIVTWFCNTR